jgi:hypothetical protein
MRWWEHIGLSSQYSDFGETHQKVAFIFTAMLGDLDSIGRREIEQHLQLSKDKSSPTLQRQENLGVIASSPSPYAITPLDLEQNMPYHSFLITHPTLYEPPRSSAIYLLGYGVRR